LRKAVLFYAQTMSEAPAGGVRGHSRRGAHSAWLASSGGILVGCPGDRTHFAGVVVNQTLNGGMILRILVFKVPKSISRILGLFSRKKDA